MVTLSGFNRVLHLCLGLRNHLSNMELRLHWHQDRSPVFRTEACIVMGRAQEHIATHHSRQVLFTPIYIYLIYARSKFARYPATTKNDF